jgi:hypothetical protein
MLDFLVDKMNILSVIWESDGIALFGTATSSQGQVLYRLAVEILPGGGGWDWSVWRADAAATAIGHGTSASSAIAKASAEEAARAWDAANRP